MKHLASILIIMFILVTLGACSGGSGGSSGSSGSDSADTGAGGGGGGSDISSQMEGAWKSVCIFIGGIEPYITIAIAYSGGSAVTTTLWFTDAGCSSATGLMKINQESWVFGDTVTTSLMNATAMTAFKVDVTQNSWVLTQDGTVSMSGDTPIYFYDILAIAGNTLYLGEGDMSTTPASRPTSLDLEQHYTRQ